MSRVDHRGYVQRFDGVWFPIQRVFKLACCDCRLVHEVKISIRKGKVGMIATRDNRATAILRKQRAFLPCKGRR